MKIKVCVEPTCEAVYHNCKDKPEKCFDCGGSIKFINEKTYWSKFSNNPFQYDINTMNFYYPEKNK